MAAQYPTAVKSFTTRVAGDTIQPAHINDLQDELAAVQADLLEAPASYTPTWLGATSNPVIGNGVLTGQYAKLGRFVIAQIYLAPGTTTTFGTGAWDFSLPVAASGMTFLMGFGLAFESGGSGWHSVGLYPKSATAMYVVQHGSISTGISAADPFTWGNGDTLRLTVVYFAAA